MTFRRLVGQERARRVLSQLARTREIPGTLMFEGPPGVGKALALWEWVQGLFCTGDPPPCGQCRACQAVQRLRHPDFVLLTPESLERMPGDTSLRPFPYNPSGNRISVEAVREIRTMQGPVSAPLRVVGILNAEEMTVEAQNALLKTLEEPPSRTVFVMVTSLPERVLPTLRSRAFSVRFSSLSREAFDQVAKTLNLPGRETLFRASGGSPGLAREMDALGVLQDRDKILAVLRGMPEAFLAWVLEEVSRWKIRELELRLMVWGQVLLDAWLVLHGNPPRTHRELFDKPQDAGIVLAPHHLMQALERLPFIERALVRNLPPLDAVMAFLEPLLPQNFRDTLTGLRRLPVPDDGLGVVSLMES